MKDKLAEESARTNEEYTKLRAGSSGGQAPRERRQAPGTRGLKRPELETWTTEELRSAATTLDTPRADDMDRDELIEALLSAELSAVTGRSAES